VGAFVTKVCRACSGNCCAWTQCDLVYELLRSPGHVTGLQTRDYCSQAFTNGTEHRYAGRVV
jgi:hypothetical protein